MRAPRSAYRPPDRAPRVRRLPSPPESAAGWRDRDPLPAAFCLSAATIRAIQGRAAQRIYPFRRVSRPGSECPPVIECVLLDPRDLMTRQYPILTTMR